MARLEHGSDQALLARQAGPGGNGNCASRVQNSRHSPAVRLEIRQAHRTEDPGDGQGVSGRTGRRFQRARVQNEERPGMEAKASGHARVVTGSIYLGVNQKWCL